MKLTAREIGQAVGALCVGGDELACIRGVCTDTRKLFAGALYVALRGERFDGHVFVEQAMEQGASVLLVEEMPVRLVAGVAVVQVVDSLVALQRLAAWYREKCLSLEVVGITGSNGKTSTKDFARAVLAQRFETQATLGNLNNHIGLPLTILATGETCQVGVWEMGMNHPGEIAPLCEMARPKIGIITNVGTSHIEFMKTREAIAREKGELARALPEDGVLIVPEGDDFSRVLAGMTKARVIFVGGEASEVRATRVVVGDGFSEFSLEIDGQEPVRVTLPVGGAHMVTNALLAAAAGWVLGMSSEEIARGYGQIELTSGRLRRFECQGVRVFDDTYNANPESMLAALEMLAGLPKLAGATNWAVLGKMGEQGEYEIPGYQRVGKLAAAKGIRVLAFGAGTEEMAKSSLGVHLEDLEQAVQWLRRQCQAGDAVLFKGSRSAKIEKVMQLAFPEN